MTGLWLALRLYLASSSTTAEAACGAAWEPDSDGWSSCVCSLETWRGEAQRWAGEELPDYLPDVAWTHPGCE